MICRPINLMICLAFGILISQAQAASLDLAPMIGHVSDHEAHIWVKANGKARLSVRVDVNRDLSKAQQTQGPLLEEKSDFMGQIIIKGLMANQEYFYTILLDGKEVLSIPYASFKTASSQGQKGRVRFAFTSCLGDKGAQTAQGWKQMDKLSLDMILLLGDNHYANSADPSLQRLAYYDQRGESAWQEISRRIPVYSIWDDHDYIINDANKDTPDKEIVLMTFKDFWANPAYGQKDNPGVYYHFTRGNIAFFMLDGRYYRSPNDRLEDGHKTMLGEKQLAWLKEGLLNSKETVKFVVSGSVWKSGIKNDSWGQFLRERNDILDFIEKNNLKGVVFLSGDAHLTAAYKLGKGFLEVTSGPLGSHFSGTSKTEGRLMYFSKGKYFSVFDVDTSQEQPKLTLEVYDSEGLIFLQRFKWEEIGLRRW